MILHGYFRSSAAFRVRIALNLKGLVAEHRFVHLREGEQRAADYLACNPQGLVPALEIDGVVLTQSLAIVEYLDEICPVPPLLPADAIGRARVRALAQIIACDIHPIDNLRVLDYLRSPLGHDDAAVAGWYHHWIELGFDALEVRLSEPESGTFCHGDTPTLADVALIPQVVNAVRFGFRLEPYARIRAIYDRALALPAFADAMPAHQPDAQ